ncbi:MAG: porin family protein [Desulforegulaceae bacterium]|nr:porin family protein [Desulforegulaceae bacterium]
MKKVLCGLSIMFIFIISSTCFADSKIKQRQAYVGLNAGIANYEINNTPDMEIPILIGKAGYFIIDYIAIEGRFGFGVGDDSIKEENYYGDYASATVEIDRVYGAYLCGYVPIKDAASLYAIAGYSEGKVSGKFESNLFNSYEDSDTDSDFSYGAGIDFYIDKFCVNVEYMNYMDKDDYEISVISAGIKYNF